MKSEYYQRKLRIFICSIMLLLHVTLSIFSIWTILQRTVDEANEEYSAILHGSENHIDVLYRKVKEYSDFLKKTGVIRFVQGNSELLKKTKEERVIKEYESLKKKVEAADVFDMYIKKAYILGKNINNISLEINESTVSNLEANLPNIETVEQSGMLQSIYDDYYMQLTQYHTQNVTYSDDGIKEVLQGIENEVIYPYISDDCLIIIVMNGEYLNSLFDYSDALVKGATLRNSDGNVIYSRNSESATDYKILYIDAEKYQAEIYVVSPFWYQGIFFACLLSILILGIFMGVCIVYSDKWAARVMRPYKSLGNILDMNNDDNNPSYIEITEQIKKKSRRSNIKKNFVIVVLVGLLLPSIINAMLQYAIIQNRGHAVKEDQFKNNVHLSTLNIINKTNSILTRMLLQDNIKPEDLENWNDDEQYIILSEKYSAIGYTPAIDADRSIIYRNKEKISEKLNKKRDVFLIDIADDTNGESYLYAVKKQYNDVGEDDGYCLRIIEASEYDSSRVPTDIDFEILSKQGYSIIGSQLLRKGEEAYYIQNAPLGVYQEYSIRMFSSQKNLLSDYTGIVDQYMRNFFLLIIVIMFAAWYYSIHFVEPLEKLINETFYGRPMTVMAKLGKPLNEIDNIIVAYNLMVKKVKVLIAKQAEARIKEQEKEKLIAYAELKALENQVNPHFLYNALETINIQMINNNDMEHSRIIVSLTKMLRYSVGNSDNYVLLNDEIENLKNYITIQEIRFRDEFRCVWSLDEQLNNRKIPKFIIQPIVENSFKHGFADSPSEKIVKISTYLKNDKLVIAVFDNGKGMKKEKLESVIYDLYHSPETGSNVGLKNIYKRIQLLTKGAGTLVIESEFMKGTMVKIIL